MREIFRGILIPAFSHAQREKVTTSGSAWLIGHSGADCHRGLFSIKAQPLISTFFLECGLSFGISKFQSRSSERLFLCARQGALTRAK
jgi:hypothetical protein